MEEVMIDQPRACPPHHWLIARQSTEQGIVERWSCQRCDADREQVVSRRRPLAASTKRYVSAEDDLSSALQGAGGERVA